MLCGHANAPNAPGPIHFAACLRRSYLHRCLSQTECHQVLRCKQLVTPRWPDPRKRAVHNCMAGLNTSPAASANTSAEKPPVRACPQTMTAWVASEAATCQVDGLSDMVLLFSAMQFAIKRIASLIHQAGIADLGGPIDTTLVSEQRDAPKPLDLVANEIIKAALSETGVVAVLASEEEDCPIELAAEREGALRYVVVFDPLDGSRNIECSIPTGTIFGIYHMPAGVTAREAVCQPGSALVASGYALYSSATVAAVTLGGGRVASFTLDQATGDFLTTQPDLRIPNRGQIYSLNDARYWDWPAGLRAYIDDVRQGKGQNPKQYSARYVCSLVADLHRTIMYGGWCGNPRSHLRLVYEAAPLAFLVEQAGGEGSDGRQRILDIVPDALHHRLPLFLGSIDDIQELMSYGDVQQTSKQKYDL